MEARNDQDHVNDHDGVNAEFQAAVKAFELDLPPGFTFPDQDPNAVNAAPGEAWQAGAGDIDAYFWWEAAMVSAAVTAKIEGRDAEARRYVEALIEGTTTEVYRAHVADLPGASWADCVGRPAVERDDWSELFAQAERGVEMVGFEEAAVAANHIVLPRR